jgi:hypothetical protein
MAKATTQPGDRILNHRCPELTGEERELARQRLYALARILIGIDRRIGGGDIPTADSTHPASGNRIPSLPQA